VAPLPPAAPGSGSLASTPAPALPIAAPSVSERHLLILVPGETPRDEAVKELRRIANLSSYDARLLLSARRPRLFRRLPTENEARNLSRELAHARLPHYVVAEAEVLGLPVAKASGGEISDRHLKWRLEAPAGTGLETPFAGILLLVAGEITRERHHEKRMGSAKGASRRLTSGLRLHLYERAARVALEIDPESFDFALLGAAQTTSAHLNFQKLVSRLSELAPATEVDRGFDLEPVVLARAAVRDVTDVLAQREKGPEGVLYDDESAFRFYARWRYRLARHLARSSSPSG
jgi:hypothetical protein